MNDLRTITILGVLLLALGMAMARGQSPALPDQSEPAAAMSPSDSSKTQQDSSQTSDNTAHFALSASRIFQLTQSNPEVLVELKAFVADYQQSSGSLTQADSISDQQLFQEIASDSDLRARITEFLRSRGYVSDEEIQDAPVSQPGRLGRGAPETIPDDRIAPSPDTEFAPFQEPGGVRTGPNAYPNPAGRESPAAAKGHGADHPPARQSNITDPPDVLHRPAPYNLLSLRDLYTQIPNTPEHLKRFGSDVFVNRGSSVSSSPLSGRSGAVAPLDVPVGPDYVLGPGDQLVISIWGGISQTLKQTVDREGKITLPEVGQLQVAGLSLDRAERLVEGAAQGQFRNAHVALTIASLRTVRIYVVGDVQRPGAYEVSPLASPVNALYAAGGPTAVGSLRTMRHLRSEKQVGDIDLYDFLLHGVRSDENHLQGGDTLVVPPAGPQVAIWGAVKRPAIYELKSENKLDVLLDEAGGLTVAAALGHITVERLIENQRRVELNVDVPDSADPSAVRAKLAQFEVKDGDRIHVDTVLPYNERVIYLQGHVVRPGKSAYREGLQLSDVVRGYADLLPEPADVGEIIRLGGPDQHPETIQFNVPDALIGNTRITLAPFDTIRIFGRYEQDAPTVSVKGEVQRPGSYPLFAGMTAAQLVRTAGGFKRDALLDTADLVSYQVVNGAQVTVRRQSVSIGTAVLKNEHEADIPLKPGDILTIHQLNGWNDIGASMTIEGEVAHPGSYGLQEGEHLSDVLRRVGGFRSTAYPDGAVLTRPEVGALEEKSRQELIRQIEASSAAARLSPAVGGGDQSSSLQLIQQQQEQVLARLRSQPASGRLVIHIGADIDSWAGTPADIEVRNGDLLRIPKRPGFVLVSGQVYNASAISFVPGKSAGWYLERAGGSTAIANRKEIFVIRANGTVVGRRSGGWGDHQVLSTKLNAGDVIVVPQKIIGSSIIWRNLLSAAQIATSISIAAAVAGL